MNTRELKAARVRKGLTQMQVAQSLGLSLAAYNKRENGGRPILLSELVPLAETLELSLHDINTIIFDGKLRE